MATTIFSTLGTPGQPWGAAEKEAWARAQEVQRSYEEMVKKRLEGFLKNSDLFVLESYGSLEYEEKTYSLLAARTKHWDEEKPAVLVTGGVHGYETSGVMGALRFLETKAEVFSDKFNFVIAPCVSPWAFETINRWNPRAIDPNRSFIDNGLCEESAALMRYVQSLPCFSKGQILAHFDLHETTDTDNTVFRPSLAARDGTQSNFKNEFKNIPDGFYCVGNLAKPALEYHSAIIAGVKEVTHIAQPDENGLIIGETPRMEGLILYAARELGLCMSLTDARYVTTTEVYPDSKGVTDDQCTDAQVAVVTSGLNFVSDNM